MSPNEQELADRVRMCKMNEYENVWVEIMNLNEWERGEWMKTSWWVKMNLNECE